MRLVVRGQSKYRAKRTNGYASAKEARRAAQLKLLLKAGKIRKLVEQPSFELIPAQRVNSRVIERACSYRGDFQYEEIPEDWDGFEPAASRLEGYPWRLVVEDCKGFKTEAYRIKKKLMLHVHGIAIRET